MVFESLAQVAVNLGQALWRRKLVLIFVTLLFGSIAFLKWNVAPVESEKFDADLSERNTFEKLEAGAASRYNDPMTSMFDEGLLKETREKWILRKYDPQKPYQLQDPNLIDTSMGQAAKIAEILDYSRNGFFIECGAYDGETRSNTLYFERRLNWTGLLIEADPSNFEQMLGKNRRAFLSNTCLSTKPYPMVGSFLMAKNIGRLLEVEDPRRQELDETENNADVAHHGRHVEVQCLPLATYIVALGIKRVDYFSLDIEGLETEILETIPFEKLDIRTLSVEYIHNIRGSDYMIELMDRKGYDVAGYVNHAHNLANDVIFVKRNIFGNNRSPLD